MARKLRVEYTGAVYHAMSRGNQGNRIFRHNAEPQHFLDSLGEAFLRELLERMTERVGSEHYGRERAEAMEARAERIVREGLAQLAWGEAALETHPKGDPAKLALAVRLRAQITMTVAWIVRRLRMGTPAHLNLPLYRQRRTKV